MKITSFLRKIKHSHAISDFSSWSPAPTTSLTILSVTTLLWEEFTLKGKCYHDRSKTLISNYCSSALYCSSSSKDACTLRTHACVHKKETYIATGTSIKMLILTLNPRDSYDLAWVLVFLLVFLSSATSFSTFLSMESRRSLCSCIMLSCCCTSLSVIPRPTSCQVVVQHFLHKKCSSYAL